MFEDPTVSRLKEDAYLKSILAVVFFFGGLLAVHGFWMSGLRPICLAAIGTPATAIVSCRDTGHGLIRMSYDVKRNGTESRGYNLQFRKPLNLFRASQPFVCPSPLSQNITYCPVLPVLSQHSDRPVRIGTDFFIFWSGFAILAIAALLGLAAKRRFAEIAAGRRHTTPW